MGHLSRIPNVIANIIIAIVLLLAPAYVAFDFMRTQQRPRFVKSIWVEPSFVAVGGVINVHIRTTVTRTQCVAQVHRWIVRAADNRPVWETIEPGRNLQIGEDSILSVEVQLEATIEPGDYYYKSLVYDTCHGARGDETFTSSPPFAYFRVTPKRPSS